MKSPEEQVASKGSAADPRLSGMPASNAAGRPSKESTASYIAEMVQELSGLARSAGLETLGYLLDIAELEARASPRLNGAGPPG